MKDLDFDELDKAVNSLIANSPVSNDSVASEPKETVLNLGSDLASLPPIVASIPTVSSPVKPVAQPINRPSTGRFMDVVHPSSNMRSTMPDRPSRPLIEPIMVSRPLESPRFGGVNSFSAPKTISTPVVNNSSASLNNDDSDIDQISNDISKAMENTTNYPMESPFLPDAKVDKRPLGAFSNEQSPVAKNPSFELPINNTTINNSEQSDISQQSKNNNISALPDELQSNLLKIEANDLVQEEDLPEVQPQIPVSVQQIPSSETSLADIPVVNNPQPTAATSIPQQYTEQPSSSDQKTGSIYDTNSYHKALAPTKKKSGWLWVLWIILLLAIGAGSGAAVYFLVLPNL